MQLFPLFLDQMIVFYKTACAFFRDIFFHTLMNSHFICGMLIALGQ